MEGTTMLPIPIIRSWSIIALVAAVSASSASACNCPPVECEWVRFEDTHPGAPDFWWGEPVLIDQIRACPHAVRFEFLVKQRGVLQRAALVFPRPDPELIVSRLGLRRDTSEFASELAHFSGRYRSLVAGLNAMFSIPAEGFVSLDFGSAEADECPVLEVGRKLALQWQGHELFLRGYLDVYFATAD